MYVMLNMLMYDIIQNNFKDIWAVKDCISLLVWASQEAKSSITPVSFPLTFSLKKMFITTVFGMMNI